MPDDSKRPDLTVGALARSAGCSVDTVRFYERTGLLPRAVRSAGGQRRYAQLDLRRLTFIRRMREIDFGLGEIGRFLRGIERRSYPCVDFRQAARARATELRRQISDLRRMERALEAYAESCGDARHSECRILEELYDPDPVKAPPCTGESGTSK